MKTNKIRAKKMEQYRCSLVKEKDGYLKELEKIKEYLSECQSEYRNICKDNLDEKKRNQHFRRIFGDLPQKQREIECKIKKIDTELIEKKYANRHGYSDIEPYEVIEEKTPNMYTIRWMESVQTEKSKKELRESFVAGGFLGHYDNNLQEWNCTPCEDYGCFTIRRHKDGNWYDVNHQKYFISDRPIKFCDFNF